MPATIEDVRKIVQHDLEDCDDEQRATFKTYAAELHTAPINRYGESETVVVVARKGNEVIYWEDAEEGFNVSPISQDGQILEHWCNQDELGLALNAWIPGRARPPLLGPARPIDT
jgi:hypothetical protein